MNNLYSETLTTSFNTTRKMLSADPVEAIIMAFDNIKLSADVVQISMLELLGDLEMLNKTSIVHHEGLARIFSHTLTGADRGSLVAWLHEFTPIRIRFEGNGQFKKIVWSTSVEKAKKRDGEPLFDLNEAAKTHWADFDPERTRVVAKGNYLKGLKALARETARAGFEAGNVGNVDQMMVELQKAMEDHFRSELLTVLDSDSHSTWIAAREKDMAKADQQKTQ